MSPQRRYISPKHPILADPVFPPPFSSAVILLRLQLTTQSRSAQGLGCFHDLNNAITTHLMTASTDSTESAALTHPLGFS
jgi:hypothetical protein